jgi:DNA-binding MurR/RpiR family transcriptional regulator
MPVSTSEVTVSETDPVEPSTEPGKPPRHLTQRIHDAYSELTESERKAADIIMSRPGDIATFAAKELAERSGVSGATVSRLVRRLGYESYDEARREARSFRAAGSPFHLFNDIPPGDSELIGRHLAEENRLLETTLSMLNPLLVGEVAAKLGHARHVWFVGFRNSRFLADYARAVFTLLRNETYSLAPSGQTLAEGVAGVGKGDVVVAFGMRRRVRFFVPLLEALAAQGAEILLITDRSMRALPVVRWSVLCSIETAQPIDSYTGALAITRLLALETLRRLGPKARQRLGSIEAAQNRLRELE